LDHTQVVILRSIVEMRKFRFFCAEKRQNCTGCEHAAAAKPFTIFSRRASSLNRLPTTFFEFLFSKWP